MPELVVIFLFVLIFFGAKKIPDIAKGLGQGVREFRKAMKQVEDEVNRPAARDAIKYDSEVRPVGELKERKEEPLDHAIQDHR